jgi:large subunit ribosomal protein L13
VLRGKQKPTYSPHLDGGDFVIVVNASKVALTGRKPERKVYQRYSGYPGGLKTVTAGALRDSKPERLFRYAVGGMLPKGPLGRRMLRKLKVYGGSGHPHGAQQPQPLEVRA